VVYTCGDVKICNRSNPEAEKGFKLQDFTPKPFSLARYAQAAKRINGQTGISKGRANGLQSQTVNNPLVN
jgi:hypothetical protein